MSFARRGQNYCRRVASYSFLSPCCLPMTENAPLMKMELFQSFQDHLIQCTVGNLSAESYVFVKIKLCAFATDDFCRFSRTHSFHFSQLKHVGSNRLRYGINRLNNFEKFLLTSPSRLAAYPGFLQLTLYSSLNST